MSSGWGKNSSVFRRFRHNYTDEISPNLPGSKLCPKLDTENASLYLQGRNKITPPILNYSGIWHDILPKINSNTFSENLAWVKSLFHTSEEKFRASIVSSRIKSLTFLIKSNYWQIFRYSQKFLFWIQIKTKNWNFGHRLWENKFKPFRLKNVQNFTPIANVVGNKI